MFVTFEEVYLRDLYEKERLITRSLVISLM